MGPKKKWSAHQYPKRARDEQQSANNGTTTSSSKDDGAPPQQDRPNKKSRSAVINLGNVKGHQAVVGTCDVRNDRQATAELVDLLNAFADELYPEGEEDASEGTPFATAVPSPETKGSNSGSSATGTGTAVDGGTENKSASALPTDTAAVTVLPSAATAVATAGDQQHMSVEEMVRHEADALRTGRDKSHRFKSVNTSVKGVVMVCVMDPRVDVLRLVDAMFAEIRETGKRRSRFLERVTPLQATAYSELAAFKAAAEPVVAASLPTVAEGVPPLEAKVDATDAGSKAKAKTACDDAGGEKEAPPATPATEAVTVAVGESAGATCPAIPSVEEGASAERSAPPVLGASNAGGGDDGGVSQATTAGTGGEASGNGAPRCEKGEDGTSSVVRTAEGVTGGEGTSTGTGGDGKEMKTCNKRWKFRVDVRRRNSGLKRLDLINAVAESVGKGHSVSMASPEVNPPRGGMYYTWCMHV